MEVYKMDACRKIWFYSPARYIAQAAATAAMFAGMLAVFVIFA